MLVRPQIDGQHVGLQCMPGLQTTFIAPLEPAALHRWTCWIKGLALELEAAAHAFLPSLRVQFGWMCAADEMDMTDIAHLNKVLCINPFKVFCCRSGKGCEERTRQL